MSVTKKLLIRKCYTAKISSGIEEERQYQVVTFYFMLNKLTRFTKASAHIY